MQVSLKQLRYFVAIAEAGKVSEAAKRLHVSQPALSSALAQLEQNWDTQLFIRHKALGVTLTANGERLLGRSRMLLQRAYSLDDFARELNDKISGKITLGCFSTLAPIWVPKLLARAKWQFPELIIEIVEQDLEQLQGGVLNGQYELVLVYGIGEHERIEIEEIASCEPYVLLPAGHRLAKRAELSLSELVDEPMVLLDLPHSCEYFKGLFERAGVELKPVYRSSNFENTRCMVAEGLGYSLLNQRPQTSLTYSGSEVVMVPLKQARQNSLSIVVASHAGHEPSVRAQAVRALLKEQAAELMVQKSPID